MLHKGKDNSISELPLRISFLQPPLEKGVANNPDTTINKGVWGLKLILKERKNPTKRKPKYFLLDVGVKPARYISSLYPTDNPNVYLLEYNGVNYRFELDRIEALIKQVG